MRKRYGLLIENKALMNEWDWEQNSKENLDPNILKCGSNVRANWICSKCGNHWKTRISHRAVDGSICPECKKRLLSKAPFEKSLAYLYPDISKEWSKKNLVSPKEVYPQSNLEYWWVCPNGHPDYKMPASKRTGRKDKCPLCSNKKVVSGINDLATTFPNLMSEWDWELNDEDGYDPYKLSYGSKVKAHWKCQRNHQWRAVIYSRTTGKCNCPKCSKELKTSYPEKIIAFYVSKLFPDTLENYRGEELKKNELDVYIPSLKVGIEYDGSRWHKNQDKDLAKDKLCESLGIFLIRVREIGASNYRSNSFKIYINEKNNHDLTNAIRKIVEIVNKEFNLSCYCDVDIDRDQADILSKVLTIIKENSVANSDFIDEWDYEKNKGVNPEYVAKFSNKKYWWVCRDYKHSWKAAANKRAVGHGCIYCSGQKVLKGFNDLESQYPDVAKEWDYSKNSKNPDEVSAKSPKKKYSWICSKCGNHWDTSIYVRTVFHCGCPKCKIKTIASKQSKPVTDLDTNTTYESAQQASRETGISQGSISSCCNGKTKTAGKHRWQYVK